MTRSGRSFGIAVACVALLGAAAGIYYSIKRHRPGPRPPAVEKPIVGLEPTFALKDLGGHLVPFQGKLPYPTSELQKRSAVSLNGPWKHLRVPGDHRLTLAKRSDKTVSQLERESPEAVDPAFDDGSWKSIDIPGVENPSPDRYQDVAWYRRRFEAPELAAGKLAVLTFEAANYVADVWVNGKWVGSHEGGSTPFSFEISKLLQKGSNIVAVRVDNIPWLPQKSDGRSAPANQSDIVPFKTADWWNYGGLLRDVRLETVGPVGIMRADVRPSSARQLDVVLTTLNTTGKNVPVETRFKIYPARLTEQNLTSRYAADIADLENGIETAGSGRFELAADDFYAVRSSLEPKTELEPWQLRDPKLYVLEAQLLQDGKVLDTYYTQFGVRTVAVEKTKLLVNGNPVFLRGVAAHESYPGSFAADLKEKREPSVEETVRRDFQSLYDLNANFVRTGHRPAHPLTVLMADRLGIGVWEEVPIYWFDGKALDYQRTERPVARQMFQEMLARDLNRPSILIWGTCNECGAQKERGEFIRDLKERGRMLDKSRLIAQSAAGNDTFDKTHDECDIIGFTSYFGVFYGWTYGDATVKALQAMHAAFPKKAMVATEFGIWSERDLSNSENQIRVVRDTYAAYEKHPYVAGCIWWALNDWHTMITDPQSMGLVTMLGKKKPAYYALQELYAEREGKSFLKWYSPLKTKPIRDQLEVDLEMVSPAPFKSIAASLDGKDLSVGKMLPGGRFVFQADTRQLSEGDHVLFVRAENQSGTVLSQERTLFIDNVDERPAITPNLKSGNVALDGQLLRFEVTDDRELQKVELVIDELPPQTLEPLYSPSVFVTTLNFPAPGRAGVHTVRIRARDSGNQVAEAALLIKRFDPKNFAFLELPYNTDWISAKDGLADGTGWDFPAEELPDSGKTFVFNSERGPVAFKFGDKSEGKKNCVECTGQTLKIPPGSYKAIHILAAMHDGTSPLPFQVAYQEGLPRTVLLGFSDWWRGEAIFGDEAAIKTSFHHEKDNWQKPPGTGIYLQTIELKEGAQPLSLTVPADKRLRIFAVSLERK